MLCKMKNKAIRLLKKFLFGRQFTSFSVFGDHYAAYFLKPLNEWNPDFNWTKIFLKPNIVILMKWLNKTAHTTVLFRSEVLINFLVDIFNSDGMEWNSPFSWRWSLSCIDGIHKIRHHTSFFFIDIFRTVPYFMTNKKSEVFFFKYRKNLISKRKWINN